jgi:FkbM family methyltransferase
MKHFLDLGTHKFEGLKEFTEKLNIDNTWNVYCYEANPLVYNKNLLEDIKYLYNHIEFHNLAVMDSNGSITFHCHDGAWSNHSKEKYVKEYTTGSNALDQTPTYDIGNGAVFNIVDEEVECVDINEILNNICLSDPLAEIYIKCDIEGSEFVVLPRIIESDYISNIKQMYIEWHERFWYNNGIEEKIKEKQVYLHHFKKAGVECFIHG